MTYNYNRIALSWFMGSWKSTIAEELIKRLYWISVDVDKYMVLSWLTEGKSIKDYIWPNSENIPAFREIETQAIEQILQKHPKIIALWWWAVTIEKNVQMIKDATYKIIYLDCPFDTIKERVQADEKNWWNNRVPLNEGKFRKLYDSRLKIYEETADIIIKTDGRSVSEIVDEILSYMKVA